jgi:hypothetical protein
MDRHVEHDEIARFVQTLFRLGRELEAAGEDAAETPREPPDELDEPTRPAALLRRWMP